jgi:hypothetical protein
MSENTENETPTTPPPLPLAGSVGAATAEMMVQLCAEMVAAIVVHRADVPVLASIEKRFRVYLKRALLNRGMTVAQVAVLLNLSVRRVKDLDEDLESNNDHVLSKVLRVIAQNPKRPESKIVAAIKSQVDSSFEKGAALQVIDWLVGHGLVSRTTQGGGVYLKLLERFDEPLPLDTIVERQLYVHREATAEQLADELALKVEVVEASLQRLAQQKDLEGRTYVSGVVDFAGVMQWRVARAVFAGTELSAAVWPVQALDLLRAVQELLESKARPLPSNGERPKSGWAVLRFDLWPERPELEFLTSRMTAIRTMVSELVDYADRSREALDKRPTDAREVVVLLAQHFRE